jgi:hypothetical protein
LKVNFIFINERAAVPAGKERPTVNSSLMPRTPAFLARFLIVCLLSAGCLSFAADAGSISGTVSDPSGAVVPGAAIVLRSAENGTQRTVTAGSDGAYSFAMIPAGRYAIEVSFAGFASDREDDLEIGPDTSLHLDVQLTMASKTETIEVSSDQTQAKL